MNKQALAVCSFFSTLFIKKPAFYRYSQFNRARLPVRAQAQGLARAFSHVQTPLTKEKRSS
jgi:hypothetical protein